MGTAYEEFLARKVIRAPDAGLDRIPDLHPGLFDFQRHCVEFALRKGRSALFLGTGLGKTFCQLETMKHAAANVGAPALILAPLAVAWQIDREGKARGYDCRVVREQGEVGPGINVCNYDRIDHLDPGAFGAVSLDESSILKAMVGKTARALIDAFAATPFRLCATATPAPNDHMELANHAAFLGIMSPNEMLSRWFINDTSTASQSWRLKGHATDSFWQWVASWARMAQSPEDLGFDGSAFDLPPLNVVRHRLATVVKSMGDLFATSVSATGIFEVKRQTMAARVDAAAGVVNSANGEPWLVWCDTDAESSALVASIPGAVDVRGSHPAELKERRIVDFAAGEQRVLITKPKIAGFGMNFQHCARMAFVGRTFSYEAYFQAVRRCWRFGQKRPVEVHLVTDGAEDQIGQALDRKAAQHQEMLASMSKHMRAAIETDARRLAAYKPTHKGGMPSWLSA